MHRVSFNSISGWLVLMQKRQNGIGFPEGRLDTCLYFWLKWDGLQTPEMQWRLRALPFLTGLTRGRVNFTSSEACFTATHSSWPKSRIYLSAIPFSANHPFPTSPPDRSSVDRRMNRGRKVRSCRNESFVCFIEQSLIRGSSYPIFNHYSWSWPALRYGRTRRRTQAAEMQKSLTKIPDPHDSTTNLLNERGLLTLSH